MFAVKELKVKRLVPVKSRIIPFHDIQVVKPFTSTNIQMVLQNQIHHAVDSAFPKQLASTLDINLFGRRFNLLELDIAVEGIQELFTKLMKATTETDPVVELTTLASLTVLNEPVISSFNKITRKVPKTSSFLAWNELANEINKELNINSEKVGINCESCDNGSSFWNLTEKNKHFNNTLSLSSVFHLKYIPSLFSFNKEIFDNE